MSGTDSTSGFCTANKHRAKGKHVVHTCIIEDHVKFTNGTWTQASCRLRTRQKLLFFKSPNPSSMTRHTHPLAPNRTDSDTITVLSASGWSCTLCMSTRAREMPPNYLVSQGNLMLLFPVMGDTTVNSQSASLLVLLLHSFTLQW